MGILRKIALFTIIAMLGWAFLGLVGFPAELAFAGTYDITTENVTINCLSGQQIVNGVTDSNPVIKGVSDNGITITTSSGCTAKVTLSGVSINLDSINFSAAVKITGAGNAVIELVGANTLQSGDYYAGIHKGNSGYLEIGDIGSLDVMGGTAWAGIGGGNSSSGSGITITGGKVTATGGGAGAGIGGGFHGSGTGITIKNSAKVMVAGGAAVPGHHTGEGAAIGDGGQDNNVAGYEIDPETYKSDIYDTGYIKYYPAGTNATDINNGTATPTKTVTRNSSSQPETPSEEKNHGIRQ